MQYENRQPAEGINVTRVHPLKQFLQLAIAAVVLLVILVFVLQVSGSWLAKRIPFSFELAIMNRLDVDLGDNAAHPQMTAYLNQLAQRVASGMDIPEDIRITVNYNDEDVFNAFATVGGNLLFYRGLLDDMPDENTLAMVMAHEIAHIVHRDPVASFGGGVVSTLAVLALTGGTGSNTAGRVLGGAGTITSIQFTRAMERKADEVALAALNALYGHVNGATSLFEMFSAARGSESRTPKVVEQFVSTHPRDEDRISALRELAQHNGWSQNGPLTPLPENFNAWLK